MKKFVVKQAVHLIYNSFHFLETEFGYRYLLIRNTNADCVSHFFNEEKLINLRFDYKENLLEFSICNIIENEYEDVKCLPFITLFEKANMVVSSTDIQAVNTGYIKAIRNNAKYLRNLFENDGV